MENGCYETKTKMRHPGPWDFQKAPRFVQKAAGFVQKVAGFGKKAAGLVKTRLLLGNLHDGQLLFPIINADNLCIRVRRGIFSSSLCNFREQISRR